MKNARLLLLLSSSIFIGKMSAYETTSCYPCTWLPMDCCGECLHSFLTIGGNYSRVDFKPKGNPSFDGNLGGLQARYEYRPPDDIYAALEFKWRQGKMTGSAGKRDLLDLSGEERIGYTCLGCQYLLTLYTGFGFRFLGHHLHSFSSAATFNGSYFPPFVSSLNSLRFNYFEFYFPLGFISMYNWNSCFSLGLNFEWMAQAFTTVHISSLGGAYWKIKQKFLNFHVELPFIFSLTDCNDWQIVLSPFYQHWQDGPSTAKTSNGTPLGLPKNNYSFYGIDVNLVYAF